MSLMRQLVQCVLLLGCLALSTLWLNQGLTKTTAQSGEGGTVTAKLKPPSNATTTPPFRILCTTDAFKMVYGSYKIRCQHFQAYAAQYYSSDVLQIDAVAPSQAMGTYNATILIKSHTVPELMKRAAQGDAISLGQVYVDVIDNPRLPHAKIAPTYHVVVQNELQAKEVYGARSADLVHVVPHWFNSFAADAASPTPVLPAPTLRKSPPLRLGLIWSPETVDLKHLEQVASLPEDGSFILEPLHMEFDGIATWLTTQQQQNSTTLVEESIDDIANDTTRGDPYLYQLLFRQYDVLLVLGKARGNKQRYNSVQRAVSQMRSGVPVLLECMPSHGVLCARYPTPCQFTTATEMNSALQQMQNVTIRQECAQRGVEITQDYAPRKVIDDYLAILGFVPPPQ